jgi:DNA-binding transcriptional regulator LsrR (DeoR family)
MAKCGCAGTTCGCKLVGSSQVTVTGTGTAQDPYTVTLGALAIAANVHVDDTTSVDMTILGAGTTLDPLVISAVVKTGSDVTVTPATGGTTVIDANTNLEVFDAAATIATHTITLPLTTNSFLKEITIISTHIITALTVGGAVGTTVAGAPTTLAANAYFKMRLVGTVWRRVV